MPKLTFRQVTVRQVLARISEERFEARIIFDCALTEDVMRAMNWDIGTSIASGVLNGWLAAMTLTLRPQDPEMKQHEREMALAEIDVFRLTPKGHLRASARLADLEALFLAATYLHEVGQVTSVATVLYQQQEVIDDGKQTEG